jgi:prephenate dehydratase
MVGSNEFLEERIADHLGNLTRFLAYSNTKRDYEPELIEWQIYRPLSEGQACGVIN